jgi:hypothetical protein
MVPRREEVKSLIVSVRLFDFPYKKITVKFMSLRLKVVLIIF